MVIGVDRFRAHFAGHEHQYVLIGGAACELIMDEVGFQPLSRADAALLFSLVSCRYRRGSMIITTDKSVQDWPEILAGDEVMATALPDRLLHHCHVFNLQGRSFRLRALEAQLP